jgi:hypothetical protein
MKPILFLSGVLLLLQSCEAPRNLANREAMNSYPSADDFIPRGNYADTMILRSHFSDKNATISEDDIQKVLNGSLKLPEKLRVAIVKLENPNKSYSAWNDEDYIKLQQLYMERFTNILQDCKRVAKISLVPGLLAGYSPSMAQLREVAVRMQADVVVVFTTQNDLYARYRLFSKTKYKAFATTQLLLMDVRTGLVPFTQIATRDFLSEKEAADAELSETRNRAQREAVKLTIDEVSNQLVGWLNTEGK